MSETLEEIGKRLKKIENVKIYFWYNSFKTYILEILVTYTIIINIKLILYKCNDASKSVYE